MLRLALALSLFAAVAQAAVAPLPEPTVHVTGRTATIALPYRSADKLAWAPATGAADSQPFMFQSLDLRPGAGPGGTDLAVFTYAAGKAGSAVLKFGLAPVGKVLIAPPGAVYKGPFSATFQTQVSAP